MIVGNGFLAKEFLKRHDDFTDSLVFARGVSNSDCIDLDEFKREKKSLEYSLKLLNNKKLLYFSTLSIDRELDQSEYSRHNLDMENFIKQNVDNYLILRVPNLVGRSQNKAQLIPFLVDSMSNLGKVSIYKNNFRSLLDVEDLVCISNFLNRSVKSNQTVKLIMDNNISVEKIVDILISILSFEDIKIDYISKTEKRLEIDKKSFSLIHPILGSVNLNPYQILHKYYGT